MKVNWEKIREQQFPALKSMTHLKAAGGSPLCKYAHDSGVQYFNEMYTFGDVYWDKYFEELEIIRKKIANSINSKPHEIAFLINTSSCMNIISRLLDPGEILYPEGEFPSSIHIFKRLGFDCKKVKHSNFEYPIGDFKKVLSENTRYIIHSYIQYLTGFKQNVEDLGNFCTENGLLNIINATQAFGAFPIDVKTQKTDILVASALKWACCGYGIGILYTNEKIINEQDLPFSSWLSVSDAYSMNNENLNVIKKTKSLDGLGGTPNFPAYMALKGGLRLIEEIGNGDIKRGIKEINERIIWLTSEFIAKVKELKYKIISPIELDNRSGIITLEHQKAEEIYYELVKKNILISLRNYPQSHKKTLLRFAFNYYNNLDDINKTISVLRSIN